ncbi:aldehyde dehydrogenase [Paenibacillus sp. MBLB4367]|uniref:aldehyde dehydrogenase n=1 Tax=Paenibacillus sp. MBLB4367 TaxID=3384767 RepID=UPI003907FD40
MNGTLNINEMIGCQRSYFASGATYPLEARRERLEALRTSVLRHERRLLSALKQDLNKSEFESYAMEIGLVLSEIRHTLKHLKAWMKPRRLPAPLSHLGSSSFQLAVPYGSVLIIAPWNYPVQLALVPLIGAVAAGNTAVLKPSELAPNVSAALRELVKEAFDPGWVDVAEGGVDVSERLLAEKFDTIFFTGSAAVGKIVMAAAAKHLTPVTLELGGKSPCIVHRDANLKLAAKRIAFGKYMNAGQTCVAPDYVLVDRQVKEPFMKQLREAVTELFGSEPLRNPDYGRIVSRRHFDRLTEFLRGASIPIGGQTDEEKLTIAPTVLDDVSWHDPVMEEEIFGPILPVLVYERIDEALAEIGARPKPLALYLFSENRELQRLVTERVSFGGGCINDTIMHFGSPYLPIGGVGDSGMGRYHGRSSFETFSHRKSVLRQTTRFDLPFRYPNSKWGLRLIRKLLK